MGWRRIDSRILYENDWMQVLEDRVVNPRGGRNDYGHVRFKNRAVAVLPLDADDHTWLVGQQRYTLDAWSWELPMGGAPQGEDLLAAAKRELREETGLEAARWTELMQLHTSNSITDEFGISYLAEDLTEGDTAFDETEALEVRRLPLVDAVGMAMSGEITDAISVATLFRIALLRNAFSR